LNLRQDYLAITGLPLVPPKKAFGLWLSEFGYRNWDDVETKLAGLRRDSFPVDGFMLDLQWFGGIKEGSTESSMGRLRWDDSHFPQAVAKVADFARRGIGFMTIEEPYISKGLSEYSELASLGYLVCGCKGCNPVYLDYKPWWGVGSMIDWTQAAAGDYWHDKKRQSLIEAGILGHWTDLGEPEQFLPNDWVQGIPLGSSDHAGYHNVYNLKWAESIARGYVRNRVARRPFLLSRSGGPGIQRFGAAMWSGDIGEDLRTLSAHYNAQMHMVMSGIDYFGSDVGGFWRKSPDSALGDSYTRWLANAAWTDTPVRPHTYNLDRSRETSPGGIGNVRSNLANVRQRYELLPYYYSLAHRAHEFGEPVVPPPFFYFPTDPVLRRIGGEKLLGRDLLVALLLEPNSDHRDVYLPTGTWINFHTGETLVSKGQWFPKQNCRYGDVLFAPTFAHAGAIIPKARVGSEAMNALGLSDGGAVVYDLVVRVYPSTDPTTFTLVEDDGESIEYLSGAVRRTPISQRWTTNGIELTIGPVQGNYRGAPAERNIVVELHSAIGVPDRVTVDGIPSERKSSVALSRYGTKGWTEADSKLVHLHAGLLPVASQHTLTFHYPARGK